MRIIVVCGILLLSACAQLTEYENKGEDKFVEGLQKICTYGEQEYIDERVADINEKADPISIILNCQ